MVVTVAARVSWLTASAMFLIMEVLLLVALLVIVMLALSRIDSSDCAVRDIMASATTGCDCQET